jgi:hypothetical protein
MGRSFATGVLVASFAFTLLGCEAQPGESKGRRAQGVTAAGSSTNALFGIWQHANRSDEAIEFFPEATVSLVSREKSRVGSYRWLDDTRLRIDWQENQDSLDLLTVTISEDRLSLMNLAGDIQRYRRSGPREYFEARRRLIQRGDWDGFWRGVKKRPVEGALSVPGLSESLKKYPGETEHLLAELGLDGKDASKITIEALVVAKMKLNFRRVETMRLFEVKEAGDRADLVFGANPFQTETLKLVKEAGVWVEDSIGQALDAERVAACRELLKELADALGELRSSFRPYYPGTGSENLAKALQEAPRRKNLELLFDRRPYLASAVVALDAKAQIVDPWGRPLVYINYADATDGHIGRDFHVYSLGPDGKDDNGGGDDLSGKD